MSTTEADVGRELREHDRERIRRGEMVQSLRALATFLEDHEDVPVPYVGTVDAFCKSEDLSKIARALGRAEKSTDVGYFTLSKGLGAFTLDMNFPRVEVCERVVVGTKQVEAKFTPARTEEVVEWRCPESVLAPLGLETDEGVSLREDETGVSSPFGHPPESPVSAPLSVPESPEDVSGSPTSLEADGAEDRALEGLS